MTNAEHIRTMTDEELSDFICSISNCSTCIFGEYSGCTVLRWLRETYKENSDVRQEG